PCALSEASYRTMSAMLRITTVKANTFTTAARTPAMKNAVAVKAWASRRVTAPDGSGRFGWLTRSVSRSYRSFRALPPAVKGAAAGPAKRPPSEHLSAVLSMYSVTHRFSRRFFSITGETGAVLRPGESHVRRQGTGDRLPENDARAARGGSDWADGGTRHGVAPNA